MYDELAFRSRLGKVPYLLRAPSPLAASMHKVGKVDTQVTFN